MFRVTDTDFFPSFFGMQADRLISKDRETNHSLVTDNFNTIFAGRVMGYETSGTATNKSVIKLETGA